VVERDECDDAHGVKLAKHFERILPIRCSDRGNREKSVNQFLKKITYLIELSNLMKFIRQCDENTQREYI